MILFPLLVISTVAHAALPLVDFDRMGAVGIAGDFAGFEFFSNSSHSFDPATSSLVARSSEHGSLSYIASTNSGGRVLASCVLDNIVYLAGSFSAIGGTPLLNVASYDPSANSFAALGSANSGPNGQVDAIFCDQKEHKLWLGGNFSSPGRAVAVYDSKAKTWSAPPFEGLAGAQDRVLSITMNASETSLLFAGSFVTSFQGPGSPLKNGKNNPNVPFSSGATPFSSSLVPIPLQGAQVLGSPSTSMEGFTDIRAILCPAGDDGPGNTWFGEDRSPALITVRTFSFISASGVRLGNTFQANHGTREFSVTTIPDNTVQTLQYLDPISGQTQTCTIDCPLSNDPSLLYQDFLFTGPLSITGIQVKISEFVGASPGLHILQILSSGAFASAVGGNNGLSCYAPSSSNVTFIGDWQTRDVDTAIPGTTQKVLVSSVDVGTSPSSGPSITWMPYVSAAGTYDITLLVPGCSDMQDCESRTSVKVTVFPGEGLQPSVTTLSQAIQQDTALPIYNGPVLPSSRRFVATITMMLADVPAGSGNGGKYDLVADRVQLVLKSVNGSTSSSNNTNQNNTRNGFGFFEWPLNGAPADATNTLSNSSQTPLDSIGVELFNDVGLANGLNSMSLNAVALHPSGSIFIGGEFSLSSGPASGSANIVVYEHGSLNALPEHGLNGAVSAIVVSGNTLFVGGSFTDTASGSSQGKLRGVAFYDPQRGQWQSLGGGVDGQVTYLAMANGKLLVAGSFTKTFISNGGLGLDASGLAVWDPVDAAWINSGGFLVSRLDLVANMTSTMQLLAGNISALKKYGTSGMVMINNGGKEGPVVTPLGIQLGADNAVAVPTPKTNNTRRHWHTVTPWKTRAHLFSRQNPNSKQLSPLPLLPPATAPAVLAGAFWANNSKELVIVGGNFTYQTTTTRISSVGIYDPKNTALQGLTGAQVNGTVRALLVDNNKLYVGGEFTVPGTNANGLAVYDLSNGSWTSTNLQALQGDPAVVRSITKSSSKSNTIIVAGSFTSAGALPCAAICSFDSTTLQWNMLGDGITGEVASVTYAGPNQERLIVAGSLKMSDGTVASVAQYSLTNRTWAAVGSSADLPGPASAVEVNDGNENSLFAAGRSSDNSTPFLSFWNGKNWSIFDSTLDSNSSVGQLTMVPLQNTHPSNGVIEPDRVLMISGLLKGPGFDQASTALFDGQTLVPYTVATTTSGAVGYVATLFHSISTFSFVQRHFLATGVVILISIAVAAGVVFLLALIGILWTLFSRRDEKLARFDAAEDDDGSSLHHRPSSLLEHINAATRTTILGTSPHSNLDPEEEEEKLNKDGLDYGPDASNYLRAQTPSDAIGGMAPEEASRPAHARYSFDGNGEGELPISAGAELEVLDDRDPSWWYARDVQTGREGVVPAAYLY